MMGKTAERNLFKEDEIKEICNKYNIKYRIFQKTGIVLLDTGFDEWKIRYTGRLKKPYRLLHKNHPMTRYHTQSQVRNVSQAINCIVEHKGILVDMCNHK